ncbi:MAG: TIGR00730 family Rossman fold protein [Bacteroidota bacterium]
MPRLNSICIFCGANHGLHPQYEQVAQAVGRQLAQEKRQIVYGAGSVGLMGVVADAALAEGGYVVGVIPTFLKEKEVDHKGIQEVIVTDTMHVRKQTMVDRSEGFIALPGGLGTLDELAEILSWAQLGLHRHPVGILNVHGYFDQLIAFVDHSVEQGFVRQENRELILVDDDLTRLLAKMEAYEAPDVEKWLNREGL